MCTLKEKIEKLKELGFSIKANTLGTEKAQLWVNYPQSKEIKDYNSLTLKDEHPDFLQTECLNVDLTTLGINVAIMQLEEIEQHYQNAVHKMHDIYTLLSVNKKGE